MTDADGVKLRELQNENNDLKATVTLLMSKNDQLEAKLEDYRSATQQAKHELYRVTNELDRVHRQANDWYAQWQASAASIKELLDDKAELLKENEELREELFDAQHPGYNDPYGDQLGKEG